MFAQFLAFAATRDSEAAREILLKESKRYDLKRDDVQKAIAALVRNLTNARDRVAVALEFLEGGQRDRLLNECFEHLPESDIAAALELFARFPTGETRQIAAGRIASALGKQFNVEAAKTWFKSLASNGGEALSAVANFCGSLDRSRIGQSLESLGNIRESIQSSEARDMFVLTLLRQAGPADRPALKDWIDSLPDDTAQSAKVELIQSSIREDPQRAQMEIEQIENPRLLTLAVSALASHYSEFGYDKAFAWVRGIDNTQIKRTAQRPTC